MLTATCLKVPTCEGGAEHMQYCKTKHLRFDFGEYNLKEDEESLQRIRCNSSRHGHLETKLYNESFRRSTTVSFAILKDSKILRLEIVSLQLVNFSRVNDCCGKVLHGGKVYIPWYVGYKHGLTRFENSK